MRKVSMGPWGFVDLSDHLKRLSEAGDPLEEMARVIDFEVFRPALEEALVYSDGSKGGRPPYDPVTMFKVLILAAQNTVSDARMEFLIRDRLSWMRFLESLRVIFPAACGDMRKGRQNTPPLGAGI